MRPILNRKKIFWIVVWLISSFNIKDIYSQTTYVPLNHWVYEYLDRLETRHIIQGVLNSTRPLSRMEIARYLAKAHQKFDHLNKVEQDQLNFLNIEFKEELNGLIENLTPYQTRINRIRSNKYIKKVLPKIVYQNDRNFLNWSEDQFQVFLDPILYHHRIYYNTDSLNYTEKVFQSTNGIRLRGNLGDRLGFFIDARDSKEWGTKKYKIGNYTLPRLGFVRATSPNFIYHDETVAYLKIGFQHIQITFGKFSNYWGNGRTGSLILSDYATSYDQLKLEFIYKKFKFTSIYAHLIDYQDYDDDVLQKKKYLAAHRLEFLSWKWLLLGLSETVIFKGRSFEPAYLNPVMFFRSAEHYLGSPDNMMMGLDFKFTCIKNLKIYGELLIDDITTTKLGTNWYGNKLGILAGIFITDLLKIEHLDLRVEYTRLNPYVYSHENSLAYTHYGTILGTEIDPNADRFSLFFDYRLTMRFLIQSYYNYTRHGANTPDVNHGGDVNRYLVSADNLYPKFLGGILERNHFWGLNISYEILRNLFFKFQLNQYQFSKVQEPYARSKVINKTMFFFSFGLNY